MFNILLEIHKTFIRRWITPTLLSNGTIRLRGSVARALLYHILLKTGRDLYILQGYILRGFILVNTPFSGITLWYLELFFYPFVEQTKYR